MEPFQKPETGCGTRLWRVVKTSPTKKNPPNAATIKFNGCPAKGNELSAKKFNQQFTPSFPKTAKVQLATLRKLRTSYQRKVGRLLSQITKQLLPLVQSSINSKALGPDDIATMMLKFVETIIMIDISLEAQIIPNAWKMHEN